MLSSVVSVLNTLNVFDKLNIPSQRLAEARPVSRRIYPFPWPSELRKVATALIEMGCDERKVHKFVNESLLCFAIGVFTSISLIVLAIYFSR